MELQMEKEMQALKEQAFKAEVAYERRQEAQRRAKQDEAAKRKREQLRIRNELLEAAFDDNMDDVLRLLREGESYFDNVVSSHALPCLPCSGCPNASAYKLLHLAAFLQSASRCGSERESFWHVSSSDSVHIVHQRSHCSC